MANLTERLRHIRLLALDVDGVLSDGGLYYGSAPDVSVPEGVDEGNLHELWTWAVGQPGYDKAAWQRLQRHIEELQRAPHDLREFRMIRFCSWDGHGIRMLQDAGIKVAWITGNHWPGVRERARTLGVHYLATGIDDKAVALSKIIMELGVHLDATAYMGDDLNDLPAMRLAGLKFAPANAVREVVAIADLVTVACGGEGAVREIADLLLRARRPPQN